MQDCIEYAVQLSGEGEAFLQTQQLSSTPNDNTDGSKEKTNTNYCNTTRINKNIRDPTS
jgi:hypothetical protein